MFRTHCCVRCYCLHLKAQLTNYNVLFNSMMRHFIHATSNLSTRSYIFFTLFICNVYIFVVRLPCCNRLLLRLLSSNLFKVNAIF